MYVTMRHYLFWLHMANNVQTKMKVCCSGTRNESHTKHKRELQLFSADGPLGFVAIHISERLRKTTSGNQHVDIVTSRYSKLTCAISTRKITSTPFENIFLDNRILPCGISSSVLTESGPQVVSKFFRMFCFLLGVKKLRTTAYHSKRTVKSSVVMVWIW